MIEQHLEALLTAKCRLQNWTSFNGINVSVGPSCLILTEKVVMRSVAAILVPLLVTDDQIENRTITDF